MIIEQQITKVLLELDVEQAAELAAILGQGHGGKLYHQIYDTLESNKDFINTYEKEVQRITEELEYNVWTVKYL